MNPDENRGKDLVQELPGSLSLGPRLGIAALVAMNVVGGCSVANGDGQVSSTATRLVLHRELRVAHGGWPVLALAGGSMGHLAVPANQCNQWGRAAKWAESFVFRRLQGLYGRTGRLLS